MRKTDRGARSLTILVDGLEELLELVWRHLVAESAHDGRDLREVDESIVVLVEEGEGQTQVCKGNERVRH